MPHPGEEIKVLKDLEETEDSILLLWELENNHQQGKTIECQSEHLLLMLKSLFWKLTTSSRIKQNLKDY